MYLNDVMWGHHGLRLIIDSPDIDFFSSPCGYDEKRSLGIDWRDMLPTASLKVHNKLYFVECDVRTYLTRRLHDSRPGRYSEDTYQQIDENGNKTVWAGPETKELSLSAIRKAFAHQITKGSGIWWFDMWGGWYHNPDIMNELQEMRIIAEASLNKNSARLPKAETVIFVDEKAYFGEVSHSVNIITDNMRSLGIPFDFCMTEDAQKVIADYKVAVFTAPISSESGKIAKSICQSMNFPFIETTPEKPYFSKEDLSEFLVASGAHCYNSDGNVIYCGNGYLGIHSAKEGIVDVSLPGKYIVKPLLGTDLPEIEADSLSIDMKQYDTVFFELQ